MPPKRSVPGTGSGAVRPTGSSTAANPKVAAPSAPADEIVASTIDKSPSPGHRTLQLPAVVDDPSIHHDGDDPGPSSLFMPPSRSPSPALPDLRSKPFPPDAVEAAAYDSDDEDDEVLAVLPVYMGSALHQELHVYQYPLHTQSRPLQAPLYALDRGKDITVRVKEQVDRIEVEVPVDRGEEVWRTEEAESMGFVAVEGPGGSNGNGSGSGYGHGEIVGGIGYEGSAAQASRKKKKEAWGESMRLSSENMPKATPYFAGVVVEGALHLHPIKKIQQFRTNLTYLDERDKRRNGAEEEEQPAAPPKKAPAPPPGARAKKEEVNDGSGSIIDFRNKLRSVTAAEAADKWVPYEWSYGIDRDDVSESYDKLLLPEDKRVRLKTSTKPLDYVDKVQ